MQLLLAEDDVIFADGLIAQLTAAGFTVEHAPDGPVAQFLVSRQHFDIVILDIGLPMIDGLAVLKKIRAERPGLPVVLLTALDKLDSRIAGLNAGADDYITKPFDVHELVARLHAVLRRFKVGIANGEVGVGGLVFDRSARRVVVNGEPVELSPREVLLLELLLLRVDQVVTKDDIVAAWSQTGAEVGAGNSSEVYIHRLRRKIEGTGLSIRTVRGVGYLLETRSAPGRAATRA